MYGIVFAVVNALTVAKAYQAEARRFYEHCKSLPPEQAQRLQAERDKQRQEDIQHQRNLEVAREGRSLNFWGER